MALTDKKPGDTVYLVSGRRGLSDKECTIESVGRKYIRLLNLDWLRFDKTTGREVSDYTVSGGCSDSCEVFSDADPQ